MIEVIKKIWEFDHITALGLAGCLFIFLLIIGGHVWEFLYLRPKRKR